ncbi:MAG: hypothetical protein IKP65_01935 [Alphaproteobacteria bacterium]|nr:hypothetical protein [Alphaproteobacteria bacterium]
MLDENGKIKCIYTKRTPETFPRFHRIRPTWEFELNHKIYDMFENKEGIIIENILDIPTDAQCICVNDTINKVRKFLILIYKKDLELSAEDLWQFFDVNSNQFPDFRIAHKIFKQDDNTESAIDFFKEMEK